MKKVVVALDAGHGMSNRKSGVFDTGATNDRKGWAESTLAFSFINSALYVAKTYFPDSVEIVLTRDTPTDPTPINARVREAVKEDADVFISIHLNDSDNASAHGAEVYYRDSKDKVLASSVLYLLSKCFDLTSRGVKAEGESQHPRLAVLGFPGDACLAELCFISSESDVNKIFSDGVRDKRIEFWRELLELLIQRYGEEK